MNPELLSFPSSLVGGRPRPRRPFTDPFSSPLPSWGHVPEDGSEAVPMAPLRRLCSYFFDDGPRSEIREGDLANMRRKYAIHPSVGMRSPTEFERAPDGGAREVAVYEAYLEASFWGVIPSIIGKVSFFFGFCPSQLTPLTWRTLMAIQVLREFHGFSVGVHEILYSYYFAPLTNKAGFYHLRSRDGTPPVKEPSRGFRGNYPFGTGIAALSFVWEPDLMFSFCFVRCVPPGFLCWRSSSEAYNRSSLTIPMGDLPGNVARLPVSVVYDEYQKAKARKRRPSYTPPPRLARAALSASGPSSTSSTSVEVLPDHHPMVDTRLREDPGVIWGPKGIRRFYDRSGDLVGTRRFSRLDPEVMQEYEASEAVLEPGGLDPEIADWNPEEPRGSSLDPEIFDRNPEAIGEPRGSVLRLPRQDYYWYLFGFRIMPLGSWPLSSSYAVFYFCRKSLTGLEGVGVVVMTQVLGFAAFHVWRSKFFDCSLYFTVLLQ
ncbi:hypothetical protein IGI04_019301 [Brassica rapa subsp. trilocularis]|uniref:Uncharacterized protein n=1 Tax=Brassica rapa subsp. trilocularis TaxID=1813537 RepID=A0ABQ7MFF5_BRACM|nr:hypothetical protein IGI04_019301 [Brassica rapa subsp. trilocularis]